MPKSGDMSPEAEENQLRNLLARVRERDPLAFKQLVGDVFINGLEDAQSAVIDRYDGDGIRYGVLIAVRGVHQTADLAALATGMLRMWGAIGPEDKL